MSEPKLTIKEAVLICLIVMAGCKLITIQSNQAAIQAEEGE